MAQTTNVEISETRSTSTDQDGNVSHWTKVEELQIWADVPENGIYAGHVELVTTTYRSNSEGYRHILIKQSRGPYVPAEPSGETIKPGMKFTVTKDIVGTEYNGCEGYVFMKAGQLATIECYMGARDSTVEHQFFQGRSDTGDSVIVNVRDIIKVG